MVALLMFAWGLLAPTLGAQTTTQIVQLSQGKNLVSLAVRPTDPSLPALLGGVIGDVVSIKDAAGNHFAPGYATDLDEWDWKQAYIVYAKRPISLEITGSPIERDAEFVLSAGLNSVPYTHTEPMPVEEAFHELADVLEYVEDSGGRRYPVQSGVEELYRLEPGKGYRVRLNADATLAYPSKPRTFEGDINVNTIAEALALRGLQPGQRVGVGGYYKPGDGGGGVFEVRNSGAPTDGGLVFAPNEFVSDEVNETYSYLYGDYSFKAVPSGETLVFGSLRLVLDNAEGTDPVSVDAIHLHGHGFASNFPRSPYVNYGEATFQDDRLVRIYFQNRYGNQTRGRIHFTYRHTTSPLRLHRMDVSATLNAHWFGVRPASEGPMWTGSTDVQPILNHIINRAAELNATGENDVRTVLLPAYGVYDYFGSIELADGLTLRGNAGTELVTETDEFGHTYHPVRVRDEHTRLRVMDGEAFRHIRMIKAPSDPNALPPDAKHIFRGRPTVISPEHGAMAVGVEDIVLDGNWENNQQAWDEGWATHDELEEWGRNSPGWAGINGSAHNGKRIPQGQNVTVKNVAILGFGSNGLLGDANNFWEVENVRAGNSLWNHVIYNANGNYVNLTLTGFAWGHAAWGAGTVSNLVFENGLPNPRRQGKEVFAIRGGDAYDPQELAGKDRYFTREDGTVDPELGTRIEGFYMDLRGTGLHAPFNGLGPNIVIRGRSHDEPGIVLVDEVTRGFFHENGNGYQKALYPGNQFEYIRIVDTVTKVRSRTFGVANLTGAILNDIQTERVSSSFDQIAGSSLHFGAAWRDHEAWNTPQVMRIDSLVEKTPHYYIAGISIDEQAAGLSVHVTNSSFENTTNTLYQGSTGRGTFDALEGDLSKIRIDMENSSFNMHDNYDFEDLDLFFALTYFRNCTDKKSGRSSEDGGTYALTATGGELVVDIPTNLLWKPQELSFVEVTASLGGVVQVVGSLVASVEIVHSNPKPTDWRGPSLRVLLVRPLIAGEELTLEWSAQVRPL